MFTIIRHFWAFALIFIALNFAYAYYKKTAFFSDFLRTRSLQCGSVMALIPLLIMGAGDLFGSIPNLYHFFQPRSFNPYVISFYVSIFANWLIILLWYTRFDGRLQLRKVAPFSRFQQAAFAMDVWLFLTLLGGFIAAVASWFITLPDWILAI